MQPIASNLIPLSVNERLMVAAAATTFFNPLNYVRNLEIMGEPLPGGRPKSIKPFSGFDLLKYLKKAGLIEEPFIHLQHIRVLLEKMSSLGILTVMGFGSSAVLPGFYYCLNGLTKLQSQGNLWLIPVLGDDFLYETLGPGIVHIKGTSCCGDEVAGTGIIFERNHILTCRHVIQDMEVSRIQVFQGHQCNIISTHCHDLDDVGVLRVAEDLSPVPGLAFYTPRIAQTVNVMGFPKIPFSRHAALTIQRGEITHDSIVALDGCELFLYSAIARPGNSGGPIISNEGYLVGMTTQDLVGNDPSRRISPHYGGIAADRIARCVSDLGLNVSIPFEDFAPPARRVRGKETEK